MILDMVRQVTARIPILEDKIDNFCRKWGIKTFELFGSVLRDDFDSEHSDVDAMVTLSPDRRYTLFDVVHMEEELADLFGRPVHLTERSTVEKSENYIRRESILSEAQLVYER
jgi:predicted nucleotidyltransferase